MTPSASISARPIGTLSITPRMRLRLTWISRRRVRSSICSACRCSTATWRTESSATAASLAAADARVRSIGSPSSNSSSAAPIARCSCTIGIASAGQSPARTISGSCRPNARRSSAAPSSTRHVGRSVVRPLIASSRGVCPARSASAR
ncbi:MAG: hypothetical protein IPO81_02040 [Kouleothrix sp.]|nr:hypothetical protein [Kouleothrix sp.]